MTAVFDTFRSLERERYVSAAWFEREMLAIHHRSWLYGCHLSEIPDEGSYILRDVAPHESLILVRTGPEGVAALFNVCRHRGSRICDQPCGSTQYLRCPYHGWLYGINGALRRAPHAPDGAGFSYADYGLDRAHAEVWNGHVFVNLDPDQPAPIGPQLAAVAPDIEEFRPARNRVAERRVYTIGANWKLVMENFWECYHCPTGHPQFCFAADVGGLNASDFTAVADAGDEVPMVVEGPLPLKAGMRTLSVDGLPVCDRPLGDFGDRRGAGGTAPTTGFLLRHCTAATYFEDHAILLDFQPVSAGRTDLVMRWLVDRDAVEGRDYQLERLVELFDITNRQDCTLSERNQAGIRSRHYRPGPNSFLTEPGIYEFHRFCAQRLATADLHRDHEP